MPQSQPFFVHPLSIRWADFDQYDHVNNAVFLSYFEDARFHFLLDRCKWNPNEHAFVIARAEINYQLPIYQGDKAVVKIRCSNIGRKSFDFEYVIEHPEIENKIYATGITTQVFINPTTKKSDLIPDSFKEMLVK